MKEKSEELIDDFGIQITGARIEDVLTGTKPVTKNSIIKIHGKDVLPSRNKLDIIKNSDDYSEYKIKLKSLSHFEEMTKTEFNDWVYSSENDPYIRSRVEFISVGSIGEKIGEENSLKLSCKNPNSEDGFWSIEEVESMFPRKPGSNAEHHTLVLHKDFWKINIVYEIVKEYTGDVIDLTNENLNNHIYVVKDVINSKNYGFKVLIEKVCNNLDIVYETEYNIPCKNIEYFKCAMNRLPPSAYKSLIQKLIRYRPMFVKFSDGILIDAEHMLIMAIGSLILNPGSFVPDIQRFVTGIESATKRLAVISVEDSYTDPINTYKLLCYALLSQRTKWKPGKKNIKEMLNISVKMLRNRIYYEYNGDRGLKKKPILFSLNNNYNEKSSSLLDELKSFGGDIGMMRDIGYGNGKLLEKYIPSEEYMNFEHFVDQHWIPNLALHFDHPYTITNSKPYENFFKKLWTDSSSHNSRKNKEFDNYDFYNCQKKTLLSLQKKHESIGEHVNSYFNTVYILSESWLAAMVGVIEIEKPVNCYCTLNSDNIYEIVVTRKPSRNMDEKPIDEDIKKIIIEKVKEKLKCGIRLNNDIVPIESLIGSKVYLKETQYKEYIIETVSDGVFPWKEFLNVKIKQKIIRHIEYDDELSLYNIPNGISSKWKKTFNNLIKKTDTKVMQRVLMYLVGFKRIIEINKISRDGGSNKHQVTLTDQKAFLFFLKMGNIFPMALKPSEYKLGTFESKNPPLLWRLRDYIISRIEILEPNDNKWKKMTDKKNRILYKHQEYILESCKKNYKNNHFIWLKVGMGKTLIVLSYIKWLQEMNKIPKYIVYTLPKSALKTVIDEISYFGLKINLYIPTKTLDKSFNNLGPNVCIKNGNDKPEPYTITMITSDNHLRLYQEKLLSIISESLFIVDEVHKTLNDTQRTSAALQLSNLSQKFIAFTGTPIIDQHTYKLIWWLEQIVPYSVNTDNFWVSANSMLTKFADTNIPIERKEILAELISKEYYDLVGLSLGGKNNNPNIQQLKQAFSISSESCNIEIVKQAIQFIKRGVVIVANDIKHQEKLYSILLENGIGKRNILVMKDTVNLLPEDTSPISIVITNIKKSEGYNLTKMSVMISGVYPSNQASRVQMEGRINRIGQRAENLLYIIVHCGILTRILKDHNDAKSLQTALELIHNKTNN